MKIKMAEMSTHELLDLAITSLPTGMFICDKDGLVRFINEAYAKYLGLPAETVLGRHITEFIPNSGIPAVLASARPTMGAWRKITRDGQEFHLLVNRTPLFNSQGALVGAVSLTLFDTPEQVRNLLKQVDTLEKKLNACAVRIKSALTASYTVDSILGVSPAIHEFKSYLLRYALTDSPVLVLGATGTGKELAASALHTSSLRAEGPFVVINCAAFPKELFESEMFGYVPGAFSGAHKDGKIGLVELADQGTLFLDEVGDLPPHAQVKLLRVLEEKTLCRLGSSHPRPVDFRLVAATNRDLKSMVATGSFREDFYYRINSMVLRLPALQERSEDIPLLVRDILDRTGASDVHCADAVYKRFERYDWPGNIRELRNVMMRALSLCHNKTITLADLPPELRHTPVSHTGEAPQTLHHVVRDSEAQAILLALRQHNWNIAGTARALGISRAGIYEKMRRLGIRRQQEAGTDTEGSADYTLP